ncbi:replication initiation protein, RepL2 [Streptomyces longispororuber]|uniref:replication initiation protein, RepL2 n=1 Tax=Streptomyces longispororuber TaxID=68230 RepID=UPI0036F6ACA8
MKIRDSEDVRYLLKKTGRRLNPNQRLVVLLYASSEQRPDGGVMEKASDLAETLGMTPAAFSRTRKELAAEGWLEAVENFGRVKIYRLAPAITKDRAGGHLRVVGS